MILQNEENNPLKGAIPVGKGSHWGTLPPTTADGSVLIASANDSSGTGLTWAAAEGLGSMAASTLLGNPTGSSAVPEAITLGSGLSFSGTTLVSSGGGTPGGTSGQVQYDNSGSFGGFTMSGDASLVTSTGVITIGAGAITTGKIAAGAVTYAKIQNESASTILGNPTGIAAAPSEITLGTGLSFSGSALVCTLTGGSGLTSVGLTMPSWLTVTGSPLTSNGTVAVAATAGETANEFLATPSGTAGAVGLRAIAAADLPTTGLTITEWRSPVSVATITSNACTCDASVAEKWVVNLGAGVATTITIANITAGQTLEITTFQAASGGVGTITWAGQTIRWSGGTAGAATATASKGDTFIFACRSTGIISGAVAVPNF